MVHSLGEQFGDYRLVRLLGEGGFAEVYEAEHMHLPGVKVALKLLKGSFTPRQIEDLQKEALVIAKLNHPHIVQLRTFSIDHGRPYLAMAYAEGGTLNQRHPRGIQLTLPEILAYVRPVAEALQYAHEQKVVHRDLKPANLLLTQDGRVQVADFGIAVVAHSSRSRTLQEIAGTWVYMAPEQFRGQAEPASDQYSLAIMVYQWLCGKLPFDGNGNMYAIPLQQQEASPPSLRAPLPDLLPEIEEVVMKALAKNPKDRFASIQAFVEALEQASLPPFVPAPGQRLGDYRLVRKLGAGAFAEVYEAEHLHLGTKVAIKLLTGALTPAQVEQLRQEARTVIQLDHPHIIRVNGFSLEGKTPYLVMAYAPGSLLAMQHEQDAPLALPTIREYVRQIASALAYAHTQNIIHCDLKPENILLAQDGRLLVADFGLAAAVQTTQASQEIVGSWTYMAPEQFTGRAEPATDQYALGIMVYEWLCGEPPFTGNGSLYTIPYQHMSEQPPSLSVRLPMLSPRIEQVVMQVLAKQPDKRFASVSAFAQAFEEACTKPPMGTMLLTYKYLGASASAAAWSPDGTCIASGGADATVRIWDARTGQTLQVLQGHMAYISAVVWSPDGQRLASASHDQTVRVWETTTGKQILCYKGHTYWVNTVAWSPDGQRLASASYDIVSGAYKVQVQVWEADTGKPLLHYKEYWNSVNAVAWSPDGQRLASASDRNNGHGPYKVQIWEADTGKPLLRYDGHEYPVNAVAWSPDGQRLASASNDDTVQVWEADTGELLLCYKGHTKDVETVAWSPDGQKLASASDDDTVQVWEADTGTLLLRHEKVGAAAWSPDGQKLVSASSSSGVLVWEATTGKPLLRYKDHTYRVNTVAWSPNGKIIVSASADRIEVWNAKTGTVLLTFNSHAYSVAWSPDGKYVASASKNGLCIWESTTGKIVASDEYPSKIARWSPDGQYLAFGNNNSKIHIWNAVTWDNMFTYHINLYPSLPKEFTITNEITIEKMAWSPNGSYIAAGVETRIDVWKIDHDSLLPMLSYEDHDDSIDIMAGESYVPSIAWSPDGRFIASVRVWDEAIQVWEATSGKLLLHYKGHTDYVNAVAWSPDGQKLASASDDGTVQVWEAQTGKLLLTYRGHFTEVFDVAWSPDGETIASAGYEVQVWTAPL